MDDYLISSPAGVLAAIAAVAAFFFFLEKKTKWKLFNYFPPLIFIYVLPMVLSNAHVIPSKTPVYDFMGANVLPMFLVIMLLDVDLLATVRVMGKGIFVMLLGTLGVVIGAPIAMLIVSHALDPEIWKAFGTLAGSWIGGTGNMLAVAHMIDLDEDSLLYGYALIADNAVYLIWLPILLGSKNLAKWFHRFTGVSDNRLKQMEEAARELTTDKGKMEMRHFLYLIFIGMTVTALSAWVAGMFPEISSGEGETIISTNTYKILLVTVIGIGLSFTNASKIPGSHPFAMAPSLSLCGSDGGKGRSQRYRLHSAVVPARCLHLDIHPRRGASGRGTDIQSRRSHGGHIVGGQYRRGGVGADRRRSPQAGAGAGLGSHGAHRICGRKPGCLGRGYALSMAGVDD